MCYVKFSPRVSSQHILLGCSFLQDPEKYGLVNRSFNLVVQLGERAVAGGDLDVSIASLFVGVGWLINRFYVKLYNL